MQKQKLGIEALKTLGRTIAQGIGLGWELDEENNFTYSVVIRSKNGPAIWLSQRNVSADRLAISAGYWPKDNRNRSYYVACDAITVGAGRSAQDMVAEINRRFWPQYLQAYANAEKTAAASNERYAEEEFRMARILAACPLAQAYENSTERAHYYGSKEGVGYGEIYVGHGVDLALKSLPIDLAEEILRLISARSKWAKYLQCWNCGYDVRDGELCDCENSEDEDVEEEGE